MNIYQQISDAGIPIDHHESDLYALVTPESTAIINKYAFKCNVKTFTGTNGQRYYDIPFAYEPFWEKVSSRS